MEPAFGVIINQDNSYMRELSYGGGTPIRPEQHLANRVVNYWQTSRRKIVCELLKPSVVELSPRVVGRIDGTLVYPISVSHNWRDDVTTITLIEL